MTRFASRGRHIVRRVSFDVVEGCFPEELDLFGVAWTGFISSKGSSGALGGLPLHVGEPGDSYTPFVIMTVAAVCESLLGQEAKIGFPEILAAVQSAARNLKVPEARVARLADAIAPRLHKAFVSLQGSDEAAQSTREAQSCSVERWLDTHSTVFVDRLWEGEFLPDSSREDPSKLLKELNRRPYDLIVLDSDDGIVAGPELPNSLRQIRRMNKEPRVMLWMILTNIGGGVSHRELREVAGVDEYSQVAQYRTRFVDWIQRDSLVETMIPKSMRGLSGWEIPKHGWTAIWVRLATDREDSELIKRYRVINPDRESTTGMSN